jgi:hypothetical protein
MIMQPQDEKQNLRYDNILVTPRGIAETSGKKVVIFVPAADIEQITLKHGRSDHRPIFSISVGAIFVLIGVFGLVEFFIATRGYRYELAMMVFGAIGATLIYDALKQGYFFEVQCAKNSRRLVLSKHAQKNDIETFCQDIRKIYGYDITNAA